MKSCTLYLIRHGESELNAHNLVQGTTDSPLSPRGIAQAKTLSQQLASIHFSAAYSSNLSRAHNTAKIIASPHHLPVITAPQIGERYYGVLESNPIDDLTAQKIKYRDTLSFHDRQNFQLATAYETDHTVFARTIQFLADISKQHLGQTIFVVSHDAVMRTLLIGLKYFTYADHPVIQNTGYLILHYNGIAFTVKETVNITKPSR